jgi:hypothetical protein
MFKPALIGVSLIATAAAAAPPGETPSSVPAETAPAPVRQLRDPKVAIALSALGTVASVVAFGVGVNTYNNETYGENGVGLMLIGAASSLITPSIGEFYAGRYLTTGMGIRAASAALIWASAANSQGSSNALVVTGMLGYATGVVWDIVDAGHAANDYNRRHAINVTVSPTVITQPSGPVIGMGLGGSF